MMPSFAYIWPILLVLGASILYNVCSKAVPSDSATFGVLVLTYFFATCICLAGWFLSGGGTSLFEEMRKGGWPALGMGLAMTGLEVGFIWAYRAGWKISTAALVAHMALAVALFVVGVFFYREGVTMRQAIGMGLCFVGMFFLLLDN